MPTSSSATTRTFPAAPASVPAARRVVREALVRAGQEQWLDQALLAVSEVCTNAVLHAHTDFTVTVTTRSDGVHVQVWDDDPSLPTRRRSEASDTTGRGLELLSAVATTCGMQAVGPAKVVWFCLGASGPDDRSGLLLDRWRDRPDDLDPAGQDVREVRLPGMPAELWLSARQHHNTLMRDFSLQLVDGTREEVLPVALVAADRARSLVLAALRATPLRAREDLVLRLGPAQAPLFEALRDVLDEAERCAEEGRLLAPPGPPSVVAVRRWACAQVLGQLAGGAPTAWTGALRLDERVRGTAG